MKIVCIFEDQLYAFVYQNRDDSPDEVERLFDLWQDAEYLENFFTMNESDLRSGFFYPSPSPDEAVAITLDDAKRFQRYLEQMKGRGLDSVFRPLSESEESFLFPRQKAYGQQQKSWLRIYAIKIAHRYYVTGGAIKLTRGMKERAHTRLELEKLQRCFSYFKEQGVIDIEGAKELDI